MLLEQMFPAIPYIVRDTLIRVRDLLTLKAHLLSSRFQCPLLACHRQHDIIEYTENLETNLPQLASLSFLSINLQISSPDIEFIDGKR